MTNIVNSTLPTPNNHSEKNKPDGVFVIKQTSLDKGTQRKTTENELPSLTQCTA